MDRTKYHILVFLIIWTATPASIFASGDTFEHADYLRDCRTLLAMVFDEQPSIVPISVEFGTDYSPSGKYLIHQNASEVTLYDLEDGNLLHKLGFPSRDPRSFSVRNWALSNDENSVVLDSDTTADLQLFRVNAPQAPVLLESNGQPWFQNSSVSFSQDGSEVIATNPEGYLRQYSVKGQLNRQLPMPRHANANSPTAFTPDGKHFLIALTDRETGTVQVVVFHRDRENDLFAKVSELAVSMESPSPMQFPGYPKKLFVHRNETGGRQIIVLVMGAEGRAIGWDLDSGEQAYDTGPSVRLLAANGSPFPRFIFSDFQISKAGDRMARTTFDANEKPLRYRLEVRSTLTGEIIEKRDLDFEGRGEEIIPMQPHVAGLSDHNLLLWYWGGGPNQTRDQGSLYYRNNSKNHQLVGYPFHLPGNSQKDYHLSPAGNQIFINGEHPLLINIPSQYGVKTNPSANPH